MILEGFYLFSSLGTSLHLQRSKTVIIMVMPSHRSFQLISHKAVLRKRHVISLPEPTVETTFSILDANYVSTSHVVRMVAGARCPMGWNEERQEICVLALVLLKPQLLVKGQLNC